MKFLLKKIGETEINPEIGIMILFAAVSILIASAVMGGM